MDDALPLCVSHPSPVGRGSTRYDVFLSFERGSAAEFSLHNFRAILAGHKASLNHEALPNRLHANLAAAGVSVKGRDKSLAVGSLSQLPDPAAGQSKICIPVISNNYLSSKQCLRELAHMMERRRSGAQMVLPMFDGVDPRVVRHLTWNSVKARHSDIEGLQIALEGVGYLQAWKVTNWRQEELVKEVVQTVQRRLQLGILRSPRVVKYNVFLNFRGTDTRKGFVEDLYTNLVDIGVSVFKDDTSIPIGEDFRSELLTAITGSTIYISVLSERYGTSKWCYRELAKMFECKEKMGHTIIPVFYKVKPSDVRHLKGGFGKAVRCANIRGWDHDHARECPSGMDATREGYGVFEEVALLPGWDRPGLEPVKGFLERIPRLLRDRYKLDIPAHLLRFDDRRTSILWDVEDSTPTHEW